MESLTRHSSVGWRAFCAIVVAYAVILRLFAATAAAAPDDPLGVALSDPHALCLTEGGGDPAPASAHPRCGECCLGATHALDVADADGAAVPAFWPLIPALPAPLRLARDGPPADAWSLRHAQRGPPGAG